MLRRFIGDQLHVALITMTTSNKGELVVQRLESLFGHVRFDDDFWRERKEPFWLIVDTILSQNTSNANSGAALRNILIKYKTIEDVFFCKCARYSSRNKAIWTIRS